MPHRNTCDACHGTGYVDRHADAHPCNYCYGQGAV